MSFPIPPTDQPEPLLPTLIDRLRSIQTPDLDGFFMVKLEVTKPTSPFSAPGMHWRIFPGGQRGAVIVQPFGGRVLTVVLLQPRPADLEKASRATGHFTPPAEPIFSLLFTEKQVAAFVEKTGDDNASHRGENAVVPGLLLLSAAEAVLAENGLRLSLFRVRFFAPVRVNQPIRLVEIRQNHWVAQLETGADAFHLTVSVSECSPG